MTFQSRKSKHATTRSMASFGISRCSAIFLLTAAIAATDIWGISSSTSIFALADTECKDRKRYNIKRLNKQWKICDWVAVKPENRCRKTIIKRKRVKKKNKPTQIRRIEIDPMEYCGCTCLKEIDYEPKLCPEDYGPLLDFMNPVSCDGYERDRLCEYEHIWAGCTYEELSCKPLYKCFCSEPSSEDARTDQWYCEHWDYFCFEPSPPPREPTETPYPTETPIPPEHGQYCNPGDPIPKPELIVMT